MNTGDSRVNKALPINEIRTKKRIKGMFLIAKLIWMGWFLPTLDFVTDVFTIYQHMQSRQWVLQHLAKGLILSILGQLTGSGPSMGQSAVEWGEISLHKIYVRTCPHAGLHIPRLILS